ncbi:MAG: flagellar hook protein FlgE [Thiotrichaceae bacterium]|nr:flagellar hook protein FlgE [Thiotrichaceae bacterium]PCI15086.1 MAG: flagellar biosynthesis protein FlgE [Thiotrichales bacterium]
MPFRIALSGLNAASSELRVIGNNVANASTTGFKKARAEFADIFASSNLGSSSNAIGSGVKLSSVTQQFSQGNIGFTDNNLDLAVSGQGMFVLNDNGVPVYTRAGAFGVDRNGFIANSQGQILQGDIADRNGNLTNTTGDLQLNFDNIEPQATSSAEIALNLNSSLPVPGATPTSSLNVPSTTILDEDAPIAPAAGSTIVGTAFNMQDNYGVNRSVQIEYTHTAANTWTATLRDNVSGNIFPGSTPIDTSGTSVSPSSVDFGWVPQTGTGAQDPIIVAANISAITLLAAAADGDTSVSTASTVNNGTAQVPFSENDATTYSHSTSMTIFDSQGTPHLLTQYYRKSTQANQWEVFTFREGNRVDAAVGQPGQTVQFDTSGQLQSPNPNLPAISFNPGGGAASITMSVDISGVTQFGSSFSISSLTQDGFSTGQLSGIDISDTGIVLSRFTNGQTQILGQVRLANFTNPQGLRQLGDTTWAESFESGQAVVSQPGSSGLGLVQSGALEGSNVDLTEQLVGMITAQRNFQANAQVISTADTITQAIINIR